MTFYSFDALLSSEGRALIGEEIELACEAWIGWAGDADTNISWVNSHGDEYKINSSINSGVAVEQAVSQSGLSTSSKLRITELSEEDGGEYFCRTDDNPTKQSTKVIVSLMTSEQFGNDMNLLLRYK